MKKTIGGTKIQNFVQKGISSLLFVKFFSNYKKKKKKINKKIRIF